MKITKEENKAIVLYTESLLQSIVADVASIVILAGGFYVNVHYIQSRLFAAIVVILFALKIIAYMTGRKRTFTSREDAIKYLSSLAKGSMK